MFMLFNKTIRMYYSLLVFRFYYNRFISRPQACRPWAYPSLARGPGPETCGPGRAGLGPNINGRAWA